MSYAHIGVAVMLVVCVVALSACHPPIPKAVVRGVPGAVWVAPSSSPGQAGTVIQVQNLSFPAVHKASRG